MKNPPQPTPFRFALQRVASRSALGTAIALLVNAGASQAQTSADPLHYSRASSFEYYEPSDGAKAGLLKWEKIEPNNTQLCAQTTYDYDTKGNKISASTANCAASIGDALFTTRSSNTTYASQTITTQSVTLQVPAGSLATSATNARGQLEARSYHPRFCKVLGLTGPNQITANWELGAFGRKLRFYTE